MAEGHPSPHSSWRLGRCCVGEPQHSEQKVRLVRTACVSRPGVASAPPPGAGPRPGKTPMPSPRLRGRARASIQSCGPTANFAQGFEDQPKFLRGFAGRLRLRATFGPSCFLAAAAEGESASFGFSRIVGARVRGSEPRLLPASVVQLGNHALSTWDFPLGARTKDRAWGAPPPQGPAVGIHQRPRVALLPLASASGIHQGPKVAHSHPAPTAGDRLGRLRPGACVRRSLAEVLRRRGSVDHSMPPSPASPRVASRCGLPRLAPRPLPRRFVFAVFSSHGAALRLGALSFPPVFPTGGASLG